MLSGMDLRRVPRLGLLLSLLACHKPEPATTDGAGTTAAATSSTGADVTASTSATGAATTGTTTLATSTGAATASTSDGCTFLECDPTGPACNLACDPWLQDCCNLQKCVPWSNTGEDVWNAVKCVDVAPDPVPVGGACEVPGKPTLGVDDCELGAICWFVDPDTLTGTCVAQCHGSPDAPDCAHAPGTTCMIAYDGVVTLCLPPCDPLAIDCPPGQTCVAAPSGDLFVCTPDASGDGGQTFGPCEYADACDPGLFCAAPQAADECDPQASGCCLPFCDLDAPPACPGAGQQCVPWFMMGTAPAGLEHVGACVLP